MCGSKFSRLTRGLRWIILAMILVATLAGCPSTGTNGGNTNQPSQPTGGEVTNEGVLNAPGGCGPTCASPTSP